MLGKCSWNQKVTFNDHKFLQFPSESQQNKDITFHFKLSFCYQSQPILSFATIIGERRKSEHGWNMKRTWKDLRNSGISFWSCVWTTVHYFHYRNILCKPTLASAWFNTCVIEIKNLKLSQKNVYSKTVPVRSFWIITLSCELICVQLITFQNNVIILKTISN
jgi:hypothetical protein